MRNIGVVILASVALAISPAEGDTLRVPEDVATVLAAVDLAMPGDSVVIGPGTWTDRATRVIASENGQHQLSACAFARGGVTIRGAGAGATVLDVGGYQGVYVADVVFIQRPGEGPLRLEGMTLTGASGIGGAVVGLYSDGLEIRSCRFEANRIAVEVGNCPLWMIDCDLIGNSSPLAVVWASLTPIHLTRCRFEGNTGRCVQTNYDAGPVVPAIFQDCEFVRNRGPGVGTALNLQNVNGYLVERCLFQENVAETTSGGALRTSGGRGTIRFCTFAYDSTYPSNANGGGVRVEGGNHEVHSNTFVGCYAGLYGAAFGAASGASGTFHNNVVAYSPRPAVRFFTGTSFTSGCNLFWANTAGDFGGGGAPAPTDFTADPLFCDLPSLDLTVRNDSPCLDPPTPSCGPIGAFGAGCGGVAIEPTSFGRLKSMFR